MTAITSTPIIENATASNHFADMFETSLCLSAIAALISEDDIPIEELMLRIHQYSACAEGVYCPEVAFDPVAIRLQTLATRYHGSRAGVAWRSGVSHALAELIRQLQGKRDSLTDRTESAFSRAA